MKLIYLIPLFIVSCATTSVSPLQKMTENNEGQSLTALELTDKIVGNTLMSKNGNMTYWRDDGVKLASSDNGTIVRKWYRDDGGVLCQTLVSSNEVSCFADAKAFGAVVSGSTIYQTFDNANKVHEFELLEGNAGDLVE